MTHFVASLAHRARLFVSLVGLAAAGLMPACAVDVDDGGSDEGAKAAEEDPCTIGEQRECEIPDSVNMPPGQQTCIVPDTEGAEPAWGPCELSSSTTSTPLVLSFDGGPVVFSADATASFDLTGGEKSIVTDWPAAATPWLALDRNHNGAIDDGGELFGSATVLANGARAKNGFAALAELDSNGDGRVSAEDAAWNELQVWSDRNGNRVSEASELAPVSSFGLVSIELSNTLVPLCDARGNCEGERASLRFMAEGGREQRGAVIDVYLAHR
ncbi:calcium-binding protein [Polyangium sp. 6x1]|uniref:calcium-binding protein n=1 Tax=Polyangium sp. 6x1 TaxID=3042689 RepID=UPI002482C9B7|nr:calcium-binding protein [Polyangium sp. 6x1]MDI1442637.1 calcium-binding protein [Polyangium sp. 6x1]